MTFEKCIMGKELWEIKCIIYMYELLKKKKKKDITLDKEMLFKTNMGWRDGSVGKAQPECHP